MTGKIVGSRYWVDGVEVTKAAFDVLFPSLPIGDGAGLSSTPPHKSDGLAVHPRQVAEATESAKRRGVPTEFLPDGRPVMRSRAHQKAYLKAYGFHNRDGGYGD